MQKAIETIETQYARSNARLWARSKTNESLEQATKTKDSIRLTRRPRHGRSFPDEGSVGRGRWARVWRALARCAMPASACMHWRVWDFTSGQVSRGTARRSMPPGPRHLNGVPGERNARRRPWLVAGTPGLRGTAGSGVGTREAVKAGAELSFPCHRFPQDPWTKTMRPVPSPDVAFALMLLSGCECR